MVQHLLYFLFVLLMSVSACNLSEKDTGSSTNNNSSEIRGWNILSDNESNALRVIEAASNFDINHFAPVSAKTGLQMKNECADVLANDWVRPEELNTLEYVKYIATEKDYSVRLIEEMLEKVKGADLNNVHLPAHQDLLQTMERTLLTARMRCAAAKVYYGLPPLCQGRFTSLGRTANFHAGGSG